MNRKRNDRVADEPWLRPGGFCPDPAERRAEPAAEHANELDAMRDSVRNEPTFIVTGCGTDFACWLAEKRARNTRSAVFLTTLVAALLAGPFAVVGAFISGSGTTFAIAYILVFGPVTEELLKQSGMIYLLERRPYRVVNPSQIVLVGLAGALSFSIIENIVYQYLYLAGLPQHLQAGAVQLRWTVCTAVHLGCSFLASLGLVRVWQRQVRDGKPADLSAGFGWFAVAMAIHGTYNLFASVLNSFLFGR